MTTTLQFDEAAARRLVTTYETADMVAQRAEVLVALAPQAGERVLDVGSGPGLLAAAIAERVGAEGLVCGIDLSAPLLAYAQSRFASPKLVFQRAEAAALPFADASFDALTCTQVLEYVADVDAALHEFARVLRPGGRMVVVDTDWDSVVWNCSDRDRMRRVLAAWDAHCTDPFLPRTLGPRLRRAGFDAVTTRAVPLLNLEFAPATYSAGMIDVIAAFVTGRDGLNAHDVQAWVADLRAAGDCGEYFFSLNRYLFCGRRRG